jgi:O-antigen/teichoic acid export membrane protein
MSNSRVGTHVGGRFKIAVATSLLSKIISVAIQAFASPLVGRELGPSLFGVYSLILSIPSYAANADLGIGPAITRAISLENKKVAMEDVGSIFCAGFLASIIGSVFALIVVLTLLVFGGIGLLTDKIDEVYHHDIYIALVVTILLATLQIQVSLAGKIRIGYHEIHINNIYGVAGNLVSATLLVIVAMFFPKIYLFCFAVLSGGVIVGFINAWQLYRTKMLHAARFVWGSVLGYTKKFIADGLLFSVSILSLILERELTKYSSQYHGGPSAAGNVSISIGIVILGSGVLSMVTGSLFPSVVEARSHDDVKWLDKIWRRVNMASLVYGTLAAGGFALFGKRILVFMYGSKFVFSDMFVWLTAAYLFLNSITHVRFFWLTANNQIKVLALVSISELLFCGAIQFVKINLDADSGALAKMLVSHFLFSYLVIRVCMIRMKILRLC